MAIANAIMMIPRTLFIFQLLAQNMFSIYLIFVGGIFIHWIL